MSLIPEFANVPAAATIQPETFKVAIPDSSLSELKQLLKVARVAPPTHENSLADHSYGLSSNWIERSKSYWETTFDWRKHEAHMNSFPHFTAPIVDDDGKVYNIHFVALFSKKPDAIPIVLLHGWPGSFLEFLPILGLVSARYEAASDLPYHLIVPSLPGYGFSSPPPMDRRFVHADVARLCDKLMVGLGFEAYVAQGGDIGSRIARIMAATYKNCKAVHLNFCYMPEVKGIDPASINDSERIGLVRYHEFTRTGYAYSAEHATRPATLGFVLSSSPLALLAWIGEKLKDWSDEDLTMDTILESISLYWFTNTIATSFYPYKTDFNPRSGHDNPDWYINKPFGYSWFPKEITPVPRAWAATTGDLVFYRQHSKGGHFAALERPEVLFKDLEDFITQVWPGI